MIKKYNIEEIDKIKKEIFFETIEPTLIAHGFKKSEHNFSQYDYVPGIGYIYELFKPIENNKLVRVTVKNIKAERTIKISLNIFENNPDSIEFALMEISEKEERMDTGLKRGIFPFNKLNEYKIPSCGFGANIKIENLKKRIKNDMENIDCYIKKWQLLHK